MGDLVMNKSLFYAKIFELPLECCNSLTISYLDFKRDFDRIFRPAIWKIFKKITLISLRISTYKDTLMSFVYPNSRCYLNIFWYHWFFQSRNKRPSRWHSITFFLPFSNGTHFGIIWQVRKLTDYTLQMIWRAIN